LFVGSTLSSKKQESMSNHVQYKLWQHQNFCVVKFPFAFLLEQNFGFERPLPIGGEQEIDFKRWLADPASSTSKVILS
jgi:hypothetical protein